MADKSVLFDIVARDKASDAFDSAGRSANKLGDTTKGMGTKVKAALAGATLAAGAFAVKLGGDAIKAAKESMKVAAQTDAVIKSTGGTANVSAKQIGKYAHQLQMMSGVSDEAIQSGQNMLLTFTNVQNRVGKGNNIFDQATKTMLDMSVAMGTDASSTAIQLGKALNDPIKGISALSRVGVTFTEQQKEQIKTMVAAGDTAGAQKLILAELSKEFGGSAKAAGDAMTAGDRLSMKWGDMQEQLGAWLIPRMNELVGALTATAAWIDRNREVVVPVVAVLGTLTAAIVAVTTAAKIYTAIQGALNVVLAANPVGLVVVAIAALATGLVVAYQKSETFRRVVQTAFAAVKTYVTPARIAIEAIVDAVQAAIGAIRRLANAAGDIPGAGVIGKIGGLVGKIPGFDLGGIVPGPIGSPQLIMAHGGETVLPTHRSGAAASVTIEQNIDARGLQPQQVIDLANRHAAWQLGIRGGL